MSSERQAFNEGFDKGYTKSQERIAQLEAEVERLDKAFDWSAQKYARLEVEKEQVMEALAEHSLYYLDDDGNELFDQPLNWEARLLQALGGK